MTHQIKTDRLFCDALPQVGVEVQNGISAHLQEPASQMIHQSSTQMAYIVNKISLSETII